jgi:hypothetical protein
MTKRQSGDRNEQSHSEPGQQLNQQNQQGGKTVGQSGVGLGGLGNQVNQGQAQQEGSINSQQGLQTPGSSEQQKAGGAERGTMNKPGDANESGSAGSTRRDDGAAVKGR